MIQRVLVADDDRLSREFLAELVRRRGAEVVEAEDGDQAARALSTGRFDLVLSDVRMPGLDGVAVARKARESGNPPVILLTAHGSLSNAVDALRAGALDYLQKPIAPDELESAIDRATATRAPSSTGLVASTTSATTSPTTLATPATPSTQTTPALIGASPALRDVIARLERAARSKATVLLEGESGTGKEALAALVHERSARAAKPFIKVNCAALAEGVLESELFGHERGAFTGAHERRIGRFEAANGGTILLDEVSEVSTAVQAKLLRVLEEEELERVGGTKTVQLDVRVVATTNRDLAEEVARGTFRADLYFRLAVLPVVVPPLRERPGDVRLLVEHFVRVHRREVPTSRVRSFAASALALLEDHAWPGNVRELENVVRRAVVLDRGEVVEAEAIRAELKPRAGSGVLKALAPTIAPATPVNVAEARTVEGSERGAIERALTETGGNRTRAAQILGISVRTLFNKLKRYESESSRLSAVAPSVGSAIA